ncbi:unnamed protein product [Phytophthora fragariaefolia]|uniref:Unnamed protein product n=1 Tax=Phytophthora fragariaefolia TaxID=1490495 RepID=A0A9W6Y2E4_9STRA|nr:unnamed protein product [Phytophthora fragariaefolia]
MLYSAGSTNAPRRDVEFAQLLQASTTPAIGIDETLKHLAPPSKNSATVRMNPELLYPRIPTDYDGYILSFDGSAKTEKNGGYGSYSWILWRLPSWDIEIAASAHLPSTTVNIAEYTGMNNGVVAALQRGVSDLIIVVDSRLGIVTGQAYARHWLTRSGRGIVPFSVRLRTKY